MEPIIIADPRIYGGEAPLATDVPTIDPLVTAGGGAVGAQPYVAPARVSQDGIGAGTSAVLEGQALIANAAKPEATTWEASKAAMKSWSTTRVWDAFNAPKFAPDVDFDVKPYLRMAPITLSETEHRFLAESKSADEYGFKLSSVQDQRKLYEQMGDHPVVSGLIGVVDPVYLAIDLASFGTSTVATRSFALGRAAQRTIAGGTAAAGALAVGKAEQSVAAISDGDVLTNALVNGAATAMFLNKTTKRFERVDPTYPSDELASAATRGEKSAANVERRVQAEQADVSAATKRPPAPVVGLADDAPTTTGKFQGVGALSDRKLADLGFTNLEREATDAFVMLGRFEDDHAFGAMIRTLRTEHGDALSQVRVREGDVTRAAYQHADATVYLDRKTTAFTALHESVHGLTVQKLEYGLANPGTAHGKLTKELEDLRLEVKAVIDRMPPAQRGRMAVDETGGSYFANDIHEFVAGLYAGDFDKFTKIMSMIPVTGSRTALTKMVNVVRKLLGLAPEHESALTKALGISDELMRTKLNVESISGIPLQSFAPNTITPKGSPAQKAQQVGGWWDNAGKRAGGAIEWSLNRELRGKGTEGARIADILVDDPVNMTGNSATSQRSAIRGELMTKQFAFEDGLLNVMAERGAGGLSRLTKPREAARIQSAIEREVADELVRRENLIRKGQPFNDPNVDPSITKLADQYGAASSAGLREEKAAGVFGSDTVKENAGYFTRKWGVTQLEEVEGKLIASGSTERAARKTVRDMVAAGIRRADAAIPQDIADDMAQAITERTRRKGYFEDAANTGTMGDDGAQGIRALLQGSSISSARLDAIEQFLVGRKDDAGKLNTLKHRIDMDMTSSIQLPDGSRASLLDLVDTSMTRNLDGYLDSAAGAAALARKGLVANSDIVKLRSEFLAGVTSEAERRKAAALFDNTIKAIKGQPVGEELGDVMRRMQAVTTSVGLANSGMWQLMEYANIAGKYGLAKTFGNAVKRLPILKQLIGEVAGSADDAKSMAYVLKNNSSQDIRIRPFVTKLEDNFHISADSGTDLWLQQAKQYVPYINAMKYVHHAQANMTANLITDLVQRGVKGDAKARKVLAQYGLEGHQLDALLPDIQAHGMTIDKWADGSWANVRGGLNKMMDDAVLKNRTGELPSFAQFSTLGKFIFTFRSFVLGAHNKVLAGTLGRNGLAGLGLLMAYQFPLAMATTYAVGAMKGKAEGDENKLAQAALTQMSAMGLFSELWGVVSGQKQQFGSSGLMSIDRLYKAGSQVGSGNFGAAGGSLASAVPLLAIMPGVKALAEEAKAD